MLYLFNPDLIPLSKSKQYGLLEKQIYFSINNITECKKRFKIELTFSSKANINNKCDYILIEKDLINSNKIEILDIDDYTEPTKIIERRIENYIQESNEENRKICLDAIEENKEFFIGYSDDDMRFIPTLVFYDPEQNNLYSKKVIFKVAKGYYSTLHLNNSGIKNSRKIYDEKYLTFKEKIKKEIEKKYLNNNIVKFYFPNLTGLSTPIYGNFKIFNKDVRIKRDADSTFCKTFTLELILKYNEYKELKINVFEFSKDYLPYGMNSKPRIDMDELLKVIPYFKLINKIKILEKEILENNPVKFLIASNLNGAKNIAYIFKENNIYSICQGTDDNKIPLLNSTFLKCMQELEIQVLGMNFMIYADKEFLLENIRFKNNEIIIKSDNFKDNDQPIFKSNLLRYTNIISNANFEFVKASLKSQLSKDEWNSLMLLSEIDT